MTQSPLHRRVPPLLLIVLGVLLTLVVLAIWGATIGAQGVHG